MAGKFWRGIEWLGRLEMLHVLATSEFVRTLLVPTVGTVIGAAAGVLGDVPLMWVMVGSSLMFMAITQSLLRADEYRERRNPQNKLKHQTIFNCDLEPAEVPAPAARYREAVDNPDLGVGFPIKDVRFLGAQQGKAAN